MLRLNAVEVAGKWVVSVSSVELEEGCNIGRSVVYPVMVGWEVSKLEKNGVSSSPLISSSHSLPLSFLAPPPPFF